MALSVVINEVRAMPCCIRDFLALDGRHACLIGCVSGLVYGELPDRIWQRHYACCLLFVISSRSLWCRSEQSPDLDSIRYSASLHKNVNLWESEKNSRLNLIKAKIKLQIKQDATLILKSGTQ